MTPTTPSKSPVDTIREAGDAMHEAIGRFRIAERDTPEAIAAYGAMIKAQAMWSAALSSLSTQPAQKVLDPIKVEDAVIGWLVKCRPDLHIPAYSEVIASLVHRIMELAPAPSQTDWLDPKALAILFHDTYERLAPSFGYDTRKETRTFDPDSANGKLMIAVCSEVSRYLPRQKGEVDMETVIDIRAAIIELMGTGVKVPTTEDLIAYMATSPSNSNP